METSRLDAFRFFHRLRIRWGECDMQGIVFNPHYMALYDVAFTEYMRTVGLSYPEAFAAAGVDIFMVSSNIDYRDAARYDDEVEIGVRTSYFGTTSFRMCFAICRAGCIIVEGTATYVTGDRTTRASQPLASWFMDRIRAFERMAPEVKRSHEGQAPVRR